MSDNTNPTTAVPPLVATHWLAQHLDDPRIAIVGILSGHVAPDDTPAGLPQAHNFHWKQLLWDEHQRQFVGSATLLQRLADAGVDTSRHLVFYGDPTQFAFYARWAFLRAGLRNVSVVDGGLRAWRADGLPLAPLTIAVPRASGEGDLQVAAREQDDIRIGREQLLQRLGDTSLQIVDVRTREEYDGQRVGPEGGNHGAERAGHIPGARLLPFASLLDGHGRLLPVDQLRRLAEQADLDPRRETVLYCRLSHRSTLVFFVLTELLQFPNVRVYDGSWTEWGSLVGAPIAH